MLFGRRMKRVSEDPEDILFSEDIGISGICSLTIRDLVRTEGAVMDGRGY